MTATDPEQISVGELLKDAPKNWGKWGPDDEVGSLNYLTPDVIVKAAGRTLLLRLAPARKLAAVLPCISAWMFFVRRVDSHPRSFPMVFVIVFYLSIVAQGLAYH